VLNDAVSIYFADATFASAFVARWCSGEGSRLLGACSKCARMSRFRGSGRRRTERRNGRGPAEKRRWRDGAPD
jgi:hypothetical protein